jgi:hypothetical protein
VRFTREDDLPAPDDKPGLYNTPFIAASYGDFGHFILGRVTEDDTTEYVIGVPGIYNEEQQAQAQALGFSEFKCYEDTPPAAGEFGYWLMFVG